MSDYDTPFSGLPRTEPETYTARRAFYTAETCRQPKEAYFTPRAKSLFGRDRHPKECDCQRRRRESREAADRNSP